jgi:phosphoserine phosphatase
MLSETVAIILGASQWPKSSDIWPDTSVFKNSAEAFRRYLLAPGGLNIPSKQVLDLFDDPRSHGEINEHIEIFLKSTTFIKNILIYYTGHGAFTEGDHKYCIAVRSSRAGDLGASGYRISSLARVLNKFATDARRFLILDSCFAGAAVPDFMPQSDATAAVGLIEQQTMDAMSDVGTALLCAASSSEQALAPINDQYTMFSGALLQALSKGSNGSDTLLSFDDLHPLIWSYIRNKFRDLGVPPNLYDADQRRGGISKVGFFPNAARRAYTMTSPTTVPSVSGIKFAVFLDVDLTLTEDYIQSYFARALDCYDDYKQKLEDKLEAGEITSEAFGRGLIKLFSSKGFTMSKAQESYGEVVVFPFAKKLFRMPGVDTFLVSSGPSYFIDLLGKEFNIPQTRICRSEYRFDEKTGLIKSCLAVNSLGKQRFVMEKSIGYDITIGIGDSVKADGGFVNICTIPLLTKPAEGFIHVENFNYETVFMLVEKLLKALRIMDSTLLSTDLSTSALVTS